ncbi:adenylate/guanylate cyclase domain-containing protein [Spirulina sp. 06S082]|uniref:adenylate/guanylate cyclase domain-containing protein n=1 Tax=Spirulina sp. 06S082 TaxID=3110248 RepID=UPI002B1F0218|nr:adenylate/guanylate cyclase domain-containing protein [Spirulina sp. 06S082]MEA5467817.1 adenylate/guanylate cyclase domain-containing protein [Spirulina sp. 06S082]
MIPSKFFFACHSLFKARLSRYISYWVFLAILTIEILILIPSYHREEQDLLQQLENLAKAKINLIIILTQKEMKSDLWEQEITSLVDESELISGLTMYDGNGKNKQEFGNPPQLTYSDFKEEKRRTQRSPDGLYYDAALSPEYLGIDRVLIIRHNAGEIQSQLYQYIFRISILVIIIGAFVTIVTIIAVGYIVIIPILRLRDDLRLAGDALSHDRTNIELQSFQSDRQDELGEVMNAFQEMFLRVGSEIVERKKADEMIRHEQEKSEQLLLNILPKSIAKSLKEGQKNIAQKYDNVTILFADIVGFTQLSSEMSPEELVSLLNEIFSIFDRLTDRYDLEKIKTIGDNYMVVGGLPIPKADNAALVANMALDMIEELKAIEQKHQQNLRIRIGMNTGSVVAGVIGTKKFIYDLWGDAVNIASRMESHGIPGQIQVTQSTYNCLQDRYLFQERGAIEIKGKGNMLAYLLVNKKEVNYYE